ncbi:barstar family protein [Ornithinimicrobium panacihumi]|uniref:barstar family protein n=1 Tax=Ornithinimicrobium panacihumi TaxID=2008449 RepID=UPI003F8B3EC8
MIITQPENVASLEANLRGRGYAVATATTPVTGDFRATQAEIARALRLPESAGTNLDALEDSLRDLPEIWGGPVALHWQDAETLARHDGPRFWILCEILDGADMPVIAGGQRRRTEAEPEGEA